MKALFPALLIVFVISSCNNFKSKHPQAATAESTPTTEGDIKHYADSINGILNTLDKRTSLVYDLGEKSFYTIQYSSNGTPLLYQEFETGEAGGMDQKQFYLKEGDLVLFTNQTAKRNAVTGSRDYFRNNVKFYSESKSAADTENFAKTAYSKSAVSDATYADELQKLDDAIEQKGRFELVFDKITEDPKYLILSKPETNAYRAPVSIETEDDFIQKILANPDSLHGKKINFQWKIVNNEAVYVPAEFMH